MKINIHNVNEHGSISAAIEARAKDSDSIASGIIGPSFSCSGPGSGWQKNHDVSDYAERALMDDYGAASYIDSDDGREATLDEDGDVVWSDECEVEIEMPSTEEALGMPEAFANMAQDINNYEGQTEGWEQLEAVINNMDAAVERIDGSKINDGESVVYYDDNAQKYYLAPMADIADLSKKMLSDDEDISRSAYSHWCACTSHPECDEDGEEITEEVEA